MIGLTLAAAESGRRVNYSTLAGLIESLTEAETAGNLARHPKVPTDPTLLESGRDRLPADRRRWRPLFSTSPTPAAKEGFMILTFNRGFAE